MKDESQMRDELRSLAGEVAEGLEYLRELGADGFESDARPREDDGRAERTSSTSERAATSAPTARVPSPALARNARAEAAQARSPASLSNSKDAPPPPPESKDAPPHDEAPSILYQEAMPTKKPVRAPSPDPPAPRETLFGDITPKDELSLGRPGETFDDIRADVGECIRCPLHKGRTKIVHTEGSTSARLMFVGEAPGADEDASGRPFVGRAGQLLNKIIEAIGLKREDVLIGNVNRCRPPQNRTPTTEEAHTCKPFLLREIAVARPEVIVVLGNTAMKNLLDTKEGITRVRGQFQDYKGIKVMPTFHPAYLLRDPSKKRETWEDMKKVRDYLNSAKGEK